MYFSIIKIIITLEQCILIVLRTKEGFLKIFFILLSLTATVWAGESLKFESYKYECLTRDGHERSNFRAMEMTVQVPDSDYRTSNIQVSFTDIDQWLPNKYIVSLSDKNTVNQDSVVFEMDKDPYGGRVGTFFWSFKLPNAYLTGSVPSEFNHENRNLRVAFSWKGTPSGGGNNTGMGFLNIWSCRKL